jgi:hypothetical protein
MKIIPAILDSYRSLKDRTFKLVFQTNELTPEQTLHLQQNLQAFGYLVFKQDKFEKQDLSFLDDLQADKESIESIGKTKSQQLRAVLFRLWEQDNEGFGDFDLFYGFKMNALIKYLKNKLD